MERIQTMKRVTGACLQVVIMIAVAASCTTAPPPLVQMPAMKDTTVERGLGAIRFCADDQCKGRDTGFTLTIQDKHVVIYLDLSRSEDVKLITNIRKNIYTDPRIIIRSLKGETIGSIVVNHKTIDSDIVRESIRKIPVVSPKGTGYFEMKKTIKNPTEINTQEREYGDGEIIPQSIPVNGNFNEKVPCIIYLVFNLHYKALDKSTSDDTSLNFENTTVKNICTSPTLFYLKKNIPVEIPAKVEKAKKGETDLL